MTKETLVATASPEITQSGEESAESPSKNGVKRRSFLKGLGVAGAALSAGSLLTTTAEASQGSGIITVGDVAILRFLAAAEILESDLWLQYQELGGVQDDEVATLASKLIPGYPAKATGGNPLYMQDLLPLDSDMSQYIHDNTEDELTHEVFINEYLASKGAEQVNLDQFRTLPSSKATGANQFGRLTNLTQLSVDTSWWTRYRSRTKNPDFGDTFRQAIPTLAVGQHPAIPRTDSDANDANFFQAIVNTAGFHFAFIEQGGSSLYPQLAQRVSHVEVLRILLSIGGSEIMHFQTWHDKAGNATNITDGDLTFPNLNAAVDPNNGASGSNVADMFQSNLIMPEPTVFLNPKLGPVSIIRPTSTQQGGAVASVVSFAEDGLFLDPVTKKNTGIVDVLMRLAEEADEARREF
jgi:hypothetical protein